MLTYNPKCRSRLGHEKYDNNEPKTEYVCLWCGKKFTIDCHRNSKVNKYCSRECFFKHLKAKRIKREQEIKKEQDKRKRQLRKACVVCGKKFSAANLNQICCCDECRKQRARDFSYQRAKEKHDRETKPRKCKYCGQQFIPEYGSKRRAFCCDDCSKKYGKMRERKQRLSTIRGRLDNRISKAIHKGLSSKGISKNYRHWEDLVGYSLEDLLERLESQFKQGMSWSNYGKWHIDHIRPKASFEFENVDDEDFKACWSLNNLQPMWARKNIKKSDSWDGQCRLVI